MFTEAVKQLKIALILLLLLTILTGLLYPLLTTVLAQLIFPWKANGSLIEHDGHAVGSLFIGQLFTDAKYFWGRASATNPYPYNGESSSGSNLGPANISFLVIVNDRAQHLRQADPANQQLIPVDLVTASASGLDPEISPLAAFYQVPRIAKTRHLPEKIIRSLVQQLVKNRTLGILGEPRVNVLQLNLALDQLPRQ